MFDELLGVGGGGFDGVDVVVVEVVDEGGGVFSGGVVEDVCFVSGEGVEEDVPGGVEGEWCDECCFVVGGGGEEVFGVVGVEVVEVLVGDGDAFGVAG